MAGFDQSPPDWLFPVRPGDSNDELRFALRSLVNVPHGRVFIVGYQPSWVKNVIFIPGGNSDIPAPRANLYNNIRLACRHEDMSDEIVITNDDIYLIGECESVPVLYRGPLKDQVRKITRRAGTRGWWQESMLTTLTCLQDAGYPDPLSYELHTPFPVVREAMAATLDRFAAVSPRNPPQWRTLYGVTNEIGGTVAADCKALRPGPLYRPFHSTDDASWRYFRGRFLELFPEPSPYETPTMPVRRPTVRPQIRPARRLRA